MDSSAKGEKMNYAYTVPDCLSDGDLVWFDNLQTRRVEGPFIVVLWTPSRIAYCNLLDTASGKTFSIFKNQIRIPNAI
jgi:hypothetical protein